MRSQLQNLRAHLNALEEDLDRQKRDLARIEESIKSSKNPNLEKLSAVRLQYRLEKIKSAEAAFKEAKKEFESTKKESDSRP
jgi:hypothetical protein